MELEQQTGQKDLTFALKMFKAWLKQPEQQGQYPDTFYGHCLAECEFMEANLDELVTQLAPESLYELERSWNTAAYFVDLSHSPTYNLICQAL